ncbi:helix-turn-helix domain-containing protein [Streptomyces sp. NPDC005374]|uniref:helix-turn-helix domain-containing protein n=1 Tax=Streptomyces sp. NPDC005374 TaxID=3364713 RepID=UPI0036C92147
MDTQNPSAPSRARSRVAAKNHPNRDPEAEPGGGLLHDHTRHTTRFTVIGNHLSQHPELSLLAIGLATHLQSLPQGACADIKFLADRFPEGRDRIAAALRELEAHGYLRRERRRIPGGRIVTRTVSCNQPKQHRTAPARRAAPPAHDTPRSEKPSLRAVPQPACPSPGLLQKATDLLAGLRRIDSRLPLSARDTGHLAPGVAAWLERDVTPTAVRDALTADLPPDGPRHPAAFLAHRLTDLLPPPPPPFRPLGAAPPAVLHPFQDCDGCTRVFRAPEPGRCRDCRAAP